MSAPDLEKAREFLTNRFRMLTLGQQYEALGRMLEESRVEAFKAGQERMREKAAGIAAQCWGGKVEREWAEGTAEAVRALPIDSEPER